MTRAYVQGFVYLGSRASGLIHGLEFLGLRFSPGGFGVYPGFRV